MPGPGIVQPFTGPGGPPDFQAMFEEQQLDDGEISENESENYAESSRRFGLPSERELRRSSTTLEALLVQAGVDVDEPAVQQMLQDPAVREMLKGPFAGALADELATQYPAVPQQDFDLAFAQSGFEGAFTPSVDPAGMAALTSGTDPQIAQFRQATPNFETNEQTGWIRYANGVLVSPDGQVAFDPTTTAPGSERWKRETVSKWGDDKVAEWRKRLHEYGYLTKDQSKVKGVDVVFTDALTAYHMARYNNGGKPVAGDLAAVSGVGGATKPPLVNFEDMGAQIRNDVREQYRRIFGEDPSDGEVAAWSDYIMRTGMTLQKRFRGKEYGAYTSMAATEAEERFIERLENSPQAEFLRESDEENTLLRDALQQSVIVANSLGG